MSTHSSNSTHDEHPAGHTARVAVAANRPHGPRTESTGVLLARVERLLGRSGRLTLQRVRAGDWQASTLYARGGQDGDIAYGDTAAEALTQLLWLTET